MQGSSISAVRIERTAHPVPSGDVSAGQRHCVVRDRIELSTFRFSGAILRSRAVAGRRLISHLTCMVVAGCRPVSLSICLRWLLLWLPVWLPDPAGGESPTESRRVRYL
jgi:hypothetical protein